MAIIQIITKKRVSFPRYFQSPIIIETKKPISTRTSPNWHAIFLFSRMDETRYLRYNAFFKNRCRSNDINFKYKYQTIATIYPEKYSTISN